MLFPTYAECCLMSVRPRLKFVEYYIHAAVVPSVLDPRCAQPLFATARTFVAITIWSRTPRSAIHCPMSASELSSWYPFAVSTKFPPAA